MQRRKFVIGLGSLAAGAAAATGTGAFESGRARGRRVDAEIEDDPDAYIGIEPAPNKQGQAFARVDDESGRAVVDFNGIENNEEDNRGPDLPDGVGEGPNGNARFVLPDVLTITNQTPEKVDVSLSAVLDSIDATGVGKSGFNVSVAPQGDHVTSVLKSPGVAISLDDDASDATLGVGDVINVDFAIDTRGFESQEDGTGSGGEDAGEDSFAVDMTVHADSTS